MNTTKRGFLLMTYQKQEESNLLRLLDVQKDDIKTECHVNKSRQLPALGVGAEPVLSPH